MKISVAASTASRNPGLLLLSALVAGVLVAGSPPSYAQKPEHPVLEGVWNPVRGAGYGTGGLVNPDPPLLSAAGQEWADGFELAADETINCVEDGVIRQIIHPYPQETRQGLDTFLILYEAWEAVRVVYLDGRGHPQGQPKSLMGHSIGHYEGNTLVVETVGLAAKINNLPEFHMLSDQHTVTERYSRSEDGQTLTIDVVVTDPVMLAEPWRFTKVQDFYDGYEILDYKCINRSR